MTNVFILATVRKAALFDAATLVFKSIRNGFPTANIRVCGNALSPQYVYHLMQYIHLNGAEFKNIPETTHDIWIEALVEHEIEPFWICDTDMVLFNKVEDWFLNNEKIVIAGRYEPTFNEEWTQTIHVERLHTCLMYINPSLLRMKLREHMCSIPEPWRDSCFFPYIRQTFIPRLNKTTVFYDTCAGIFHAIGGTRFTEKQDECFEHLHCGTYADLVSKHLSCNNLQEVHKEIYKNPGLARGLRLSQNEYYTKQATLLP